MNTTKLLTWGAVGFAALAAWYVFRKPGAAVAATGAQEQRDMQLGRFLTLQGEQWQGLTSNAWGINTNLLTTIGATPQ